MIFWYAQITLTDGRIIHYGYDEFDPNTGNVKVQIEEKPIVFFKTK